MGEFLPNFGVGEANSDSKFRAVKKKKKKTTSQQGTRTPWQKRKSNKGQIGRKYLQFASQRANVFNI